MKKVEDGWSTTTPTRLRPSIHAGRPQSELHQSAGLLASAFRSVNMTEQEIGTPFGDWVDRSTVF